MAPTEPSETSPLLPKPTLAIEGGVAPSGTSPSGNTHDSQGNGTIDGIGKPQSDEEGQEVEDERAGQYEGMPDVMKQLKYIVPAVGIGVWVLFAILVRH